MESCWIGLSFKPVNEKKQVHVEKKLLVVFQKWSIDSGYK